MTTPMGTDRRAPGLPRQQVVGAWLLLVGFCSLWLGVAWDGQWHVDVGPDTFFTAPHLMFYFGSALIGLTSLAVVLANTRKHTESAVSGPAVTVLRRFRAPVPFLVAGLGAAGHLVYGGADLWWHTVYGFDLLESTPSHLSLQLAMQVQAIAVFLAFAALRGRRSGRWGMAAAVALNVAASAIMLDGTVLGLKLDLLDSGTLAAWTLCAIAGTTASARWVAASGLLFLVVHAATFVFPPFATQAYADAIDQPVREVAVGVPLVAVAVPVHFPIVAVLAACTMWLARRRGISPGTTTTGLGALVALVVAGHSFLLSDSIPNPVANVLAVVVLGALAGRFGWHCAALLRRLDPQEA